MTDDQKIALGETFGDMFAEARLRRKYVQLLTPPNIIPQEDTMSMEKRAVVNTEQEKTAREEAKKVAKKQKVDEKPADTTTPVEKK